MLGKLSPQIPKRLIKFKVLNSTTLCLTFFFFFMELQSSTTLCSFFQEFVSLFVEKLTVSRHVELHEVLEVLYVGRQPVYLIVA